MTRGGLPHSDIFGSKLVCSSPKLFAACHVLHRLLAPRHSPYTLSSLTIRNSKLTLTNRLHIDWSATVPCNTACPPSRFASLRRMNVVVGKNYRVQNIQLSKIRLAGHLPTICLRRLGDWRATRAALDNRGRRRCARDSKPHSLTETFQKTADVRLRSDAIGLTRQQIFQQPSLACRAVAPPGAKAGGEYRARTGDLLVANQALSQLS